MRAGVHLIQINLLKKELVRVFSTFVAVNVELLSDKAIKPPFHA